MSLPRLHPRRQVARLIRLGICLWFALQGVAFGELRAMSGTAKPGAREISGVWRYEAETGQKFPVPVGGKLLPNRVYVVYNPDLEELVFSITNKGGAFSKPPEALAPGTVVSGPSIGANKNERYALTAKAKWIPTRDPVQRRFWTLTKFPQYRLAVPFTERK